MRIGVNTRLLLANKLAGIGYFSHEILSRLCRLMPEHEFVFFFDREYDAQFIYANNVEAQVVFPQARHPFLYYWWFEHSLPKAMEKAGIDLFFSPDNYLSLKTDIPSVLTIHDLAFEHFPEDIDRIHRWHYRHFIPKYIRKAKQVIAVSEYTKQDIIQQYNAPNDKITTVLNGINHSFLNKNNNKNSTSVKVRFTNGEDYFLHVGTIQPRKNIVRLFQAFDAFKRATHSAVKLVMVGKKGWSDRAIHEAYEAMQYKEAVVFTGYINDITMPDLYANAVALLLVSYFEGFGLPIIEAQVSGCPVICADVSSLPEVAAGAALYCNPFDVTSIEKAMIYIFKNEKIRQDLIEKGGRNIQRFDWDQSAATIGEILLKPL